MARNGGLRLSIIIAFAERFGVGRRVIEQVGTRQLCLCRSDLARRVLLNMAIRDLGKKGKLS